MVRPWNDPSAATRWVRPVRRVSLNAASLASVPELVKNTRPSRGRRSGSNRSASSTCGVLVKKLETWPRVVSCSVTAATRAGWAWPRALTAMPPRRSTYSLPSTSQTCAPWPRASTSLGGPKVFISGAGVALLPLLAHDALGLPDLGGHAGQYLGADALVGEELEEDGVVLAAVDHGGARDAALDGLEAGRHLRHHPAGQRGHQLGQRLGRDLADHVVAVGPVAVEALDVGQHEQLLGAQRDRQRGGRGVGVHVVHGAVDVGGDGGDDGDPTGLDQVEHRLGPDARHLADQAEVDLLAVDDGVGALGGEQAGVLAGQPDGERAVLVDEADQLALDLPDEHHADDVHGLRAW